MPLPKKTIIIYDKQAITRVGISTLVAQVIPSSAILAVESKKELVNSLIDHPDSIVILDYTLSDINSADGLLNMSARFWGIHWLLFSDELSVSFLRRVVLTNSQFSVVLKTAELEEIKTAIVSADKKNPFLCVQIADILAKSSSNDNVSKEHLTLTEQEIIKEIALGLKAKEIAEVRNISVHTVVTHRKNIYRKLNINNAQELVRYALRAGFIDVSDYHI